MAKPRTLTVAEAAKKAKCSERTIWCWIRAGRLTKHSQFGARGPVLAVDQAELAKLEVREMGRRVQGSAK